jgi:ribosomal-protein-alanine N-acetyltransferase
MPSSSDRPGLPDDLRLLPMTEDDVDQVLTIENVSFASPWRREHFLHEIYENVFAVNRVYKSGDTVVAYACVWRIGEELKINNLCVAPAWRERGLGRRLLRELLGFARNNGCKLATLEVRPSNAAALALYLAEGFVETGRRANYYATEGEDAIVMTGVLGDPTPGPD